ncbi:MAG: hypothetical protein XU11_C0034G0009 [Candidatus Dadabacteria bacterium CSP1-2]|jgi:hypothetical protein|nr:MAG: hypothetical protein XU11_C0034G0009 [Candidatus Dadabacteria bacterium CSP1-2]OGE23540.1 MAG: hypothetical protein A2V51_02350 [Candidatus Dadabacteria bacterium RBG_19FT_COMBO_40_33]
MRKKIVLLGCLVLVNVLFLSAAQGQDNGNGDFPTFIPNNMMTTPYGPAFADIVLVPSNFLPCKGGPFALCYYSGPEPETCVITEDGKFARCKCFEFAYGKYFVDINAILDTEIYLETIAECGLEGSMCQETNQAPVCESINSGEFIPGADSVSTFSFECIPEEGIGLTNCPQDLYAGCMTAPCIKTDEEGIVDCLCPTFAGPYQIGLNNQTCDIGPELVWSAAFNPNAGGKTFPTPPGCIPDAPVDAGGCPLLPEDIPLPPNNIDCEEVCQEYESCQNSKGVELGFTCDATLCTSTCNDRGLVGEACSGLESCDVSEIIKLEEEVGCSCCASQICGCEPNGKTEEAVFELNEKQRERGITPQCDINGTLCGKKSPSGGSCSLAPVGAPTSVPLYFLIPLFISIKRIWRIKKS